VARERHRERLVYRRSANGILSACRDADGTIVRPTIRSIRCSSIDGRRGRCRASRFLRPSSMCSSRRRAGRLLPATRTPVEFSTHTATRNTGRCSSTCSSSVTRSGAAMRRRCSSSSRAQRTSRADARLSRIATTAAPRGRTSHCKGHSADWSFTGWLASTTRAPRPR
jgi:hypothetical protein